MALFGVGHAACVIESIDSQVSESRPGTPGTWQICRVARIAQTGEIGLTSVKDGRADRSRPGP
jgi:hypothetical protein